MFKNLSPAVLGVSGRDSEIIELVLSHGFKGLDLDLVEFAGQVEAQGFARAARLITSARLKIGSFAVPIRWEAENEDYQEDLKRLPALLDLAQQLGCTRGSMMLEPGNDRRPYHENFELYRRRLAEVADMLAPYKIRLGVGFMAPLSCRAGRTFQFMQTASELKLLFGSIASPNLGLALDSWHWHLGGGTLEMLRGLGADKIVTVALADADADLNAATADLNGRRLPGEGAIDLAGLLGLLSELRYDGPLTPAPAPSQLAGQGRDAIIKRCSAALDTVGTAAGLNLSGKRATVQGR